MINTIPQTAVINKKIFDHRFLQDAVCNAFKMQWEDIKSKSREQDIADARGSYIYLCSIYTDRSPEQVTSDVNRDRTSYYKSFKRIQDAIDTKEAAVYPKIQPIIDLLNKTLCS